MKLCLMIAFSLCFSLFSCKTYSPENLPSKKIVFGEGGGFAGTYKYFTLLPNGQIFLQTSLSGEYTELGKLKANVVKKFFSDLEADKIHDTDVKNVGNYTFYIFSYDEDYVHELSWASKDDVPISVVDFYVRFKKLLPTIDSEKKKSTQ